MEKQKIRIHKDIREAYRRLKQKLSDLPADLPLDIEVTPTSVTIGDLDGEQYTLARVKYGWPGYRVDTHIRLYVSGKRSVDDIVVKRAKDRPKSMTNAQLADLSTW